MDEHQNNRVDKLFRNSLRFYKDKPSSKLWRKIESNLDSADRIVFISKIRRRIFVAAALLMIMTGLGINAYNNIHTSQILAGQTKKMDGKHSGSLVKFQQLHIPTTVNSLILTKGTGIPNNNSSTQHQIPYLKSWDPDMNLSRDTNEHSLYFVGIQIPESRLVLVQTDRTNAFPNRPPQKR